MIDENRYCHGTAHQPTVLVIDDDPNNLAIVSELLEECEYTIIVAEDGQTGLDRASRAMPDLILMDVMMPGLDGFETCRRLKATEKTKDIPVIFMTALAALEDKVSGFAAGAVDYVTKPLQREELLARVGVHLHIGWLTSELQLANEFLEKRVEERTLQLASANQELQREIAERKLVEEALAVKGAQLETLNAELEQRVDEEVEKNRQKDRLLFHGARLAAMGELLDNIAHQWRQPLNSISLIIQGAQREFREGTITPESFAQYTGRCMELVNYMSKTINAFQIFFAPEGAGREFDPAGVVEKSVALVRASYEQSAVALRVVNEGTRPVTGGEPEFAQAVLHILNNAREILVERRIPRPEVEVHCSCSQGWDVITISDNAGGIPEEIIDKIFDPYFTTKFKSQGTGIALYMAKVTIEKSLGGALTARNTPQGAEFRIELPV